MPDIVSRKPLFSCLLLWLAIWLALAGTVAAYETDQFTHRLTKVKDSTEVLDERVNQAINEVISEWRWGHDEVKFSHRIYLRIGGRHWVDRLERWAMNSPQVEKIPVSRKESIYSGHPVWATRVVFFFGLGSTIKLNGVHIGSDKIGHFLSQGLKFYRRFRKSQDETNAALRSAYTERALFGQMTTGSYSNADLVANYEGHRFYRSLFEDRINGDKPAIVRWDGNGWILQRPFTWADHVNAYWDEALNVNHYDRLLRPHMVERLGHYCDDFKSQPQQFVIADEGQLLKRYSHLQLRDTSDLRLEHLCAGPAEGSQPATGPGSAH
jgi:hypothetical protein